MRVAVLLGAGCLVAGCDKRRDRPDQGMPPATDWQAPVVAPSAVAGDSPHGGMGNPHEGMGNPHGGDPHAGLGADPHAGMAMGGMQPPDPAQPVDPAKFLKGQVRATGKTAKLVKPGSILFLSVRPVDPATGEVTGAPLAVDRIDIQKLPVAFHLNQANSMVAGTRFAGPVLISARVDQDGEASSKQPGDVEGKVQATIPAADIELVLDTVLP